MEPRSLIMALALSRRKEMGSSLSPWQALALPSAISIPHLPSTQPSLAHFPALSYKWFLEPSRFSDSSSLRQGFYETTFPWAESASHQKVSSVWISPARVKAAAWRAYVRESRGACMLCAVRCAELVLEPTAGNEAALCQSLRELECVTKKLFCK